MEAHNCPRCNEPMDAGRISLSGSALGYVSEKQSGMIRRATTLKQAHACLNCGFVELYLDPKELKQNIS